MTWLLYSLIGLMILLFGGIFCAAILAALCDLWYQRQNRVFLELQRDHAKPRRPAAK